MFFFLIIRVSLLDEKNVFFIKVLKSELKFNYLNFSNLLIQLIFYE